MNSSTALAYCFLAPGIYLLLHGATSRLFRGRHLPPQKIAAITCLVGACLQMNLCLVGLGISLESAAFGFVTSFCTAHVYFHCFNMSETARRIKCLVARHLGKSPEEATVDTVQKAAIRLRRLRELGTVTRVGNRYHIQPGLLPWAARLLVAYERWIFPKRLLAGLGPKDSFEEKSRLKRDQVLDSLAHADKSNRQL